MAGFFKDIGPCEVWYGSTPAKVGDSYGGVVYNQTVESRDAFKDKTGVQPTDSIIVGTIITVTANLTDLSLSELAAIMPGATYTAAGPGMQVAPTVGTSMLTNAAILQLKPIIGGAASTDPADWIEFLKAYPVPAPLEVKFSNEDQKIYAVEFKIFEDTSSGLLAEWGTVT